MMFTLFAAGLTALCSLGNWPAVDDGPCPAGLIEPVTGWQYDAGYWSDGGTIIGLAPVEDVCLLPL